MSETKVTYTNSLLNTLVFVIFFVMKLTEKCEFWGNNFPRFLQSTEAWWDGWFMVFLPLWIGLPIALIILVFAIIFRK